MDGLRVAVVALLAWAVSFGAAAAQSSSTSEQVNIGPAPSWVRSLTAIEGSETDPNAPVHVLLHDQQVRLEAGVKLVYSEIAMRIQTPQGLAAASISLPWRPEADVLTVHRLNIRRGSEVIDVLASGQSFTVLRREQNLESAMLDGMLTANIQPEGVQVGDIIEVAATLRTSDPVLPDHSEFLGAMWNGEPIGRAHLSVEWPSDISMVARASATLPSVRTTRQGGNTRFDLSLDNVEIYNAPVGAPMRFALGRYAEFTTYRSWGALSARLAPLYERAATLPSEGPLRQEVERIRAQSDLIVRAEAALALVQNRIRYVALMMGQGGLTPADASVTWSRRFGDCKGKTALLLALLHDLGIEAEPVAVSVIAGDGLDQRLPTIAAFDHVLVRARIGEQSYWLDGTRSGDTRLVDLISPPPFGWALPLTDANASLVRLEPPTLDKPRAVTEMTIDASRGVRGLASVRVAFIISGDDAVVSNLTMSGLSTDGRDRAMREYWRSRFDDLEIDAATMSFDAAERQMRYRMEGRMRLRWRGTFFELPAMRMGYDADFRREPGPDQDAPYAVAHPYYHQSVVTMTLPPNVAFTLNDGEAIDTVLAGVSYRRTTTIDGQTLRAELNERSVAAEVPFADAVAAQARLRTLADKIPHLVLPASYTPSADDLAAEAENTPTDAAGFVRRGNVYLDSRRYDEAVADFTSALALDPQDIWALANRGIAYVWKGDQESAARDLNAAAARDPNNFVVYRARGLMAHRAQSWTDAIAVFTRAIELQPNDDFSLGYRAQAHAALRNDDAALADSAAALRLRPQWTELNMLRVSIWNRRSDTTAMVREAEAMLAAGGANTYSYVVAGRILSSAGRESEAMAAFDRALAIEPAAYIYINRASSRPASDRQGRLADLDAALALDPLSIEALVFRGEVLTEMENYHAAIETLTAALRAAPDHVQALAQRGVAYSRSRDARAQADFAAARTAAGDSAPLLNNLCFAKAIAGVALAEALSECDEALRLAPDSAATMDSRALVLLRLGRLNDAIAAYDQALAAAPTMAPALYGRGLAREADGETSRAQADFDAALAIDPRLSERFDRYGLPRATREE
jgi:tetratricopeptide (TPR) repeat protein